VRLRQSIKQDLISRRNLLCDGDWFFFPLQFWNHRMPPSQPYGCDCFHRWVLLRPAESRRWT